MEIEQSPGAPPHLGSAAPDTRRECDMCYERSLVRFTCRTGVTEYLCRSHAEAVRNAINMVLEGPRGG